MVLSVMVYGFNNAIRDLSRIPFSWIMFKANGIMVFLYYLVLIVGVVLYMRCSRKQLMSSVL